MSIHPPTPPKNESCATGLECAGDAVRSLGEVVRARRAAMGLTLQELAEGAGCARSYVWAIEHERREHPPSDEVLMRMEGALGLEAGRLIRAARWQAMPRDVRREVTRLRSRERVVERLVELVRGGEKRSETARQRDSETGGERKAKSEQGTGTDDTDVQGSCAESEKRKAKSEKVGRWRGLDAAYRSGELRRLIDRIAPERAGGAENSAGAGATGKVGAGGVRGAGADGGVLPLAMGLALEVPLINKVAAGYPRGFTDLGYPARAADEYVRCPDVDDPDAFAARVVGDSMLPEYREGDIVVFSPARPVASGMDCFIRTEPDHESTFKRVYFEGGSETAKQRDSETGGGERERRMANSEQGAARELATEAPAAAGELRAQRPDEGKREREGASGGNAKGTRRSVHREGESGEGGGNGGGEMIRLQPLNPAYPARVLAREAVAGLYAAVSVMRKIG